MRKSTKKITKVVDKLIEERILLLKADPEYIDLCDLLPDSLFGKESGIDYEMVIRYPEYFNKPTNENIIFLDNSNWEKYKKFQDLCQKLADKYGIDWVTVENVASGVEHPTTHHRLAQVIHAYNDPVVMLPKDFDTRKHYRTYETVSPPQAAVAIMRRVQDLDDNTKSEIKANLFTLFENQHGCRIVDLSETKQEVKTNLVLDVCLRVPIGYNSRDVAEAYRKVDKIRRDILASLGTPVPQRRRQSKILMDAESLELLANNKRVGVQAIVDERWPDYDQNQDSYRRKKVINQRYKGRKLVRRRLAE
jgi:hypothetical protein